MLATRTRITDIAKKIISTRAATDTFYIVDTNQLRFNAARWRNQLPHVKPFYAVKCNPDPVVLRTLANHGTGFDCASKDEIQRTLALPGVTPDRIVFAHPCKKPSDIAYASKHGVPFTTFDTPSELHKLCSSYPGVNALLRIKVDNPSARIPLGTKYGATMEEVPGLLDTAMRLGITVRGVSFHVGSASHDPNAFKAGLQAAHAIIRNNPQHPMDTVDIGGGFTPATFDAAADAICESIAQNPPPADNTNNKPIRYWAEPGRYMVENVFTLFTPVLGYKQSSSSNTRAYWISDGLYGSFNCILYDGQRPAIEALRGIRPGMSHTTAPSIIYGSTCDSADVVAKNASLPQNLRTGDWLVARDFGAYTIAGACDFNGIPFTRPAMFYV